MLFCGIDIGTSSVKVIIINEEGKIISSESQNLPKSNYFYNEEGFQCHEQNPLDWWIALVTVLKKSMSNLEKQKLETRELSGINIVGTSGTIMAIDHNNELLTNALMYNDGRAVKEAEEINVCAEAHCNKLGYKFSAPFALPKILWLMHNHPKITQKGKFIHCTDYIIGKMTDVYTKSDFSNTLKTGFDLVNLEWPEFIEEILKIPIDNLPDVLKPGEYIAPVTEKIQILTGIPKDTPIYAGITDSSAGLISSGAINVGDLFTVLGTTIVSKVITENLITDPKGRIYSHRFPTGTWLLGGASNCGAGVLNEKFGRSNLSRLDSEVFKYSPTKAYIYPLAHQGERFPFSNSYANGFEVGTFKCKEHRYSAYIEGLCYVEKWMFDVLHDLGAKFKNSIFTAGGATNSSTWMQLRANILNKEILIPEIPEAAFGGAVIVASSAYFKGDLNKACKQLVKIKTKYSPNDSIIDIYNDEYSKFKDLIQEKINTEWTKPRNDIM